MLGSTKTNIPLLTLTSWVKVTSPFQCETILLLLTSAIGTFMFCSLGIKVLNNNATYCYDKIFWNLRSKRLQRNKVYWNQNIIKTLSLQTCGICNVGSLFVFVIISVIFQIFHLSPNKLLRQLWLFRKSRMLLASSSPCDSCRKWPAPSTTCHMWKTK